MIDWTQARVIRIRQNYADDRGLVLVRGPEVAAWAGLFTVRTDVEPMHCMCPGDLVFLVQDADKRDLGRLVLHHYDALDTGGGSLPMIDPQALLQRLHQAGVLDEQYRLQPRELWGKEQSSAVEIRVRAQVWALANAFSAAGWRVERGGREVRVRGEAVCAVLRQEADEVVISAELGGSVAAFQDLVHGFITGR